MSVFYAGVGARETPKETCQIFTELATWMEEDGYILRSGGADGADKAFERGVDSRRMKEIFYSRHSTAEAEAIAKKYHPAWDMCVPVVRQLHGRNSMIVLGRNLDQPVKVVVAWTDGGRDAGGTGQTLRVARAYSVPIVNAYGFEHTIDLYNKVMEAISGPDKD